VTAAGGRVVRVPVAELLRYASRDAVPHRPGRACPPADGQACVCAGSVVRAILAKGGGWCPQHRAPDCRFEDLLAEYDRDGGFARPLHAPDRTVHNGHHRLAAAAARGAVDLAVSTAAREDYTLGDGAADVVWHAEEITALIRAAPGWYTLDDVTDAVEQELDLKFGAAAMPGLVRLWRGARAAGR
jgi:hypothetical protein